MIDKCPFLTYNKARTVEVAAYDQYRFGLAIAGAGKAYPPKGLSDAKWAGSGSAQNMRRTVIGFSDGVLPGRTERFALGCARGFFICEESI